MLDWSAKDAADLLEISVSAVNSVLQRARTRLRERLPSRKEAPATDAASAAERELVKKYLEAGESADYRAFESLIREDATFRMPPDPDMTEGRDAIFQVWREGGFGSEDFGKLHCVVTRANRQPAIAAYNCRPGESTWQALTLEVLRIEDGLVTEIVLFAPNVFEAFGLPSTLDAVPEKERN